MKKHISFVQCVQQASKVVVLYIALNMLRKVFFDRDQLHILRIEFIQSAHKINIILIGLLAFLVLWGILSVVGGSLYFLYKKAILSKE